MASGLPLPAGPAAAGEPAARFDTAPVTAWLVDNACAYEAFLAALATATRSVWMTQLAFDADCVACGSSAAAPDIRLADAIVEATSRAPVDVRILLNSSFLLDTARPLRRFFARALEGREATGGAIHVRGVSRFPRLLHAKMAIVDGREAFLFGSPFVNGYWDEPRHAPADARRPARELGGRPLHDLSVRVSGAPVAQLERVFAELWNGASVPVGHEAGAAPLREAAPAAPPHDAADRVRVVSTCSRRIYPHRPDGSTEILEALLDGVSRARTLLYIEHQYLSARPVAAALARALERHRALELIVVFNQNPDVTAYRVWQNARLTEAGLLNHPRVGLFALWSVAANGRTRAPGGPSASRVAVNQVFVHSKVVTVDDDWATVGSANLDGASLHSYGDDFSSALGRRVFRHVRNFDVNLVIDEEGLARGGTVASLRTRLWSEHLGLPVPTLAARPSRGWLPLWRAGAASNVAALNSPSPAATMRGFVLPYSTQPTPVAQLAEVGVRVDPARLDVCFDPGWLEVHCSPNWIRNMFA